MLSATFKIGRTPIREALQRLAREGLVAILPRKGILVSDINPRNQLLVLEVRRELERLLSRAGAERATEEQREQLQDIARGMVRASKANDDIAFMRLDRELNRPTPRAPVPGFAFAVDLAALDGPGRDAVVGGLVVVTATPPARSGVHTTERRRALLSGRSLILSGDRGERIRPVGSGPSRTNHTIADDAQHRREQQVEADAEDLRRVVDAQPLEEDAAERVHRDVQRERLALASSRDRAFEPARSCRTRAGTTATRRGTSDGTSAYCS